MAQETSPSPDLTVLDVESRDRLNTLVGQLDERAADIIRSRYGLVDGRQHKLAAIARRLLPVEEHRKRRWTAPFRH